MEYQVQYNRTAHIDPNIVKLPITVLGYPKSDPGRIISLLIYLLSPESQLDPIPQESDLEVTMWDETDSFTFENDTIYTIPEFRERFGMS